jgi:hypothetical protein
MMMVNIAFTCLWVIMVIVFYGASRPDSWFSRKSMGYHVLNTILEISIGVLLLSLLGMIWL